jgi:hypothetical protein
MKEPAGIFYNNLFEELQGINVVVVLDKSIHVVIAYCISLPHVESRTLLYLNIEAPYLYSAATAGNYYGKKADKK